VSRYKASPRSDVDMHDLEPAHSRASLTTLVTGERRNCFELARQSEKDSVAKQLRLLIVATSAQDKIGKPTNWSCEV
jgi:hypothetical protein